MRSILLVIMSAFVLSAQTLTTLQGTIKKPDGSNFSGQVQIQLASSVSAGGTPILQNISTFSITGGSFTANLVPNDTALPSGSSYVITFYNPPYRAAWNCSVPTSSTPVNFGPPVCSTAVPGGTWVLVSPGQIAPPSGSGTFCLQSVNGVVSWVAASSCGGGSGPLSLSSLTDSQLSSLTDSQLSSLTN